MSTDPIYHPAQPVVAIVGASGLVGGVLLEVLEERNFPVAKLVPLAGPSSAGRRVHFRGQAISLGLATPDAFRGVDLVFFAATGELSLSLAPAALAAGALVVDKSAGWRMDPEVPLVVPEVNADAIRPDTRLVASPNCTTTGLVMTLEPLQRAAGLKRVQVTTLQAASGAGRAGLEELEAGDPSVASFWPKPLVGNVLPLCDRLEQDGSSAEEHKLLLETRKIMGLPELQLAATCTRVPVAVGHGASVWVETERELELSEASAALGAFPGVRLAELPTARDAAGQDQVLVGRLREPLTGPGLQYWEVSDNLRKGAATNAVQIAEELLKLR